MASLISSRLTKLCLFLLISSGSFWLRAEEPVGASSYETIPIKLQVSSPENKTIFSPDAPAGKVVTLPPGLNHLAFGFEVSDSLQYSCLLNSFAEEGWSEWTNTAKTSFSRLQPGEYTFSVRSRNNQGKIVGQGSYQFIIEPHWYQNKNAWMILIGLAGITGLFLTLKGGIFSPPVADPTPLGWNTASLSASFDREGLLTEIGRKNEELATITMTLAERGKLFTRVRESLLSVIKSYPETGHIPEMRAAVRSLAEAENDRGDWEHFSIHFDEVHRNFLSALKSAFPVLSTTDLKLCAYLRLNLSSKEIAHALNITLKGVEISRYRLRKKLKLSKDVNLYDYLLRFTGKNGTTDFNSNDEDELSRFLSFFNNSMTAKFIAQGGYDFTGEGIFLKGTVSHNKG